VPLVFADQVRARGPHRHHQLDGRSTGGDAGLDLDVMRLGGREAQGVGDRLRGHAGLCGGRRWRQHGDGQRRHQRESHDGLTWCWRRPPCHRGRHDGSG
jgi:hypothetical protein